MMGFMSWSALSGGQQWHTPTLQMKAPEDVHAQVLGQLRGKFGDANEKAWRMGGPPNEHDRQADEYYRQISKVHRGEDERYRRYG